MLLDEMARLLDAAVRALRRDRIVGDRGVAERRDDARRTAESRRRLAHGGRHRADQPAERIGELHVADERLVPRKELATTSFIRATAALPSAMPAKRSMREPGFASTRMFQRRAGVLVVSRG